MADHYASLAYVFNVLYHSQPDVSVMGLLALFSDSILLKMSPYVRHAWCTLLQYFGVFLPDDLGKAKDVYFLQVLSPLIDRRNRKPDIPIWLTPIMVTIDTDMPFHASKCFCTVTRIKYIQYVICGANVVLSHPVLCDSELNGVHHSNIIFLTEGHKEGDFIYKIIFVLLIVAFVISIHWDGGYRMLFRPFFGARVEAFLTAGPRGLILKFQHYHVTNMIY